MSQLTLDAIDAIRRGDIPAPPGSSPDDFTARLAGANLTDGDWAWLLYALVRHRLDTTVADTMAQTTADAVGRTYEIARGTRQAIDEALAVLKGTSTMTADRIDRLDALVRPLFQPDIPDSSGALTWSNLWKFWQFIPGTMVPRVLLTGWEIANWTLAFYAGYVVGAFGGSWLASVGGTFLACVALFVKHELVYQWYVRTVVRVPEIAQSPGPGFISTLERWTGPTY